MTRKPRRYSLGAPQPLIRYKFLTNVLSPSTKTILSAVRYFFSSLQENPLTIDGGGID